MTFVHPEVASVGDDGGGGKKSIWRFACWHVSIARIGSWTRGRSSGRAHQLIADKKTRKIIGGHMTGERAGEVIHEIAMAMYGNMKIDDLADMISRLSNVLGGRDGRRKCGGSGVEMLPYEGLMTVEKSQCWLLRTPLFPVILFPVIANVFPSLQKASSLRVIRSNPILNRLLHFAFAMTGGAFSMAAF